MAIPEAILARLKDKERERDRRDLFVAAAITGYVMTENTERSWPNAEETAKRAILIADAAIRMMGD